MGSLVRLLVTLPPARLAQLARIWNVTATSADSLVARLYHEMTEGWSVKRVLDRLGEDHRLLLYRLADQRKGWAAGAELLRVLPYHQETLERLLLDLRELGLVAVASLDNPSLAVGSRAWDHEWRLRAGLRSDWSGRWTCWVPEDLARVIRRARAEVVVEEQTHEPLHRMLGGLDLLSLQRLALRWHLARTERTFKRELVRALEGRLSQREVVDRMLAGADAVARQLFDGIQRAGGQLSFAAAQERLGLSDQALRGAYESLHELFLVHEGYASGARALYVPSEVSHGYREAAPEQTPELAEVGPPPSVMPADDSLLDDLARLLVQARGAPLRRHHHGPSGGQSRRQPSTEASYPTGASRADLVVSPRAHYLIHACLTLGLLEPADDGLTAGAQADGWTRLEPESQLGALLRALLAEERWREFGPSDVHWPGSPALLRRQVVEALARAEPGRWYAVSSLVRRVRAGAPASEQLDRGGDLALLPGNREVLAVLGTALRWLGIVALGCNASGKPIALQVTALGRRLLDGAN